MFDKLIDMVPPPNNSIKLYFFKNIFDINQNNYPKLLV
jgi:hypothetical protein